MYVKYRYAADSCDKKWGLNNMASPTVKKVGGLAKTTPNIIF